MQHDHPPIFTAASSSDHIKSLVLLESEVEQISSSLTYLANRASKISLNTAGLTEQTNGDVSALLEEITASTKNLSADALNVRFAVDAARRIIIAHLEDVLARSHD
jgi:hypothetical protein